MAPFLPFKTWEYFPNYNSKIDDAYKKKEEEEEKAKQSGGSE